MAKKNFNELLQQKREAENKIDVKETAKGMLSKATTGEKITKNVFIKMRATEEERERWNEYAKSQNRTLTDIIREMLNERISADM